MVISAGRRSRSARGLPGVADETIHPHCPRTPSNEMMNRGRAHLLSAGQADDADQTGNTPTAKRL